MPVERDAPGQRQGVAGIPQGQGSVEPRIVDAVLSAGGIRQHGDGGELAAGAGGGTHQYDGQGRFAPAGGIKLRFGHVRICGEGRGGLGRVQGRAAADAQDEIRPESKGRPPGRLTDGKGRVLADFVKEGEGDPLPLQRSANIRQGPGAAGGAAGGHQQAALAQGCKAGRVLPHAICAGDQAARHIKLHNINSPAMI